MKQFVIEELYNELKLESIAIKINTLVHLCGIWVKQFVIEELYNELKLESIAIKINTLR